VSGPGCGCGSARGEGGGKGVEKESGVEGSRSGLVGTKLRYGGVVEVGSSIRGELRVGLVGIDGSRTTWISSLRLELY
jgi:hypothetical protein